MYALHHGGPDRSPVTQGTGLRLRPTLVILSTLFCAALSQGAGAAPTISMSKWLRLGAVQGLETVDGKSAVCVNLTKDRKGADSQGRPGRDISKPANLIYQPGIEALKPNTRYTLSFLAKRDGAGAVSASERLMASITATERDITNGKDPFGNAVSNGYWPGVYAENQLSIGSTFTAYKIDFVTPVQPRADGGTGEVMFQALSDTNSGRICLAGVRLATAGAFADGRNEESTRATYTSSVSIRYNTVTAGLPGQTQRFVITGIAKAPLAPTRVLIKRNGSVVSEFPIPSADVKTDPLTNLTYYVFETKQTTGGYTVAVQPNGAVGAETAPVTLGAYSVAAPDLKRDALHFYYAHRSSEAIVDGRYGEYRNWLNRPAGHGGSRDTRAACFSGVDNFGNDYNAACLTASATRGAPVTYTQNVQGGWYDAGDHGKYVVNAAYTLWMLQNVIELKQQNGSLATDFPAGFLKYPKPAGAPVRSDLLDEAKYEMEWLLKMQITNKNPDGTAVSDPLAEVRVPLGGGRANGQDNKTKLDTPSTSTYAAASGVTYLAYRYKTPLTLSSIEPTGLVFSAVRDSTWTGIPLSPEKDSKNRVLDYPTTAATLDFAAVAAQCYRIWRADSSEGASNPNGLANRCLKQAKVAYAAAKANPEIYRYGEYSQLKGVLPAITNGGGAYADTNVSDEFLWAGSELFLASVAANAETEASSYLRDILGGTGACKTPEISNETYAVSTAWNRTNNLGLLSMIAAGRDQELASGTCKMAKPSSGLIAVADNIVSYMNASVWGAPVPATESFNWASNADIAAAVMLLQTAHRVSPNAGYDKHARRVMDYLFGLNPLGKSYVTGYGANPARNPHHRFWAKHANINFPPSPPGLLVGGPNGKWTGSLLGGDDSSLYYMANVASKCNPLDKEWANASSPLESPRVGGVACYMDDYRLYMTNEIAINWNAPLFWASAFVQ